VVCWDDAALSNGEVPGVDGLFLAGLINIADVNVQSIPETEEISHRCSNFTTIPLVQQ
jgi:hypothetical protein